MPGPQRPPWILLEQNCYNLDAFLTATGSVMSKR